MIGKILKNKIQRKNRARAILLETIEEILFHFLKEKGFCFKGYRENHSFADFHRKRKDGGFDLFDLTFDEYRKPSFIITIGVTDAHGIVFPWGYVPPEEMTVGHLSQRIFFHRKREMLFFKQTGRIFKIKTSNNIPAVKESSRKLCFEIIRIWEQAEDWWRTGKIGENLYEIQVSIERMQGKVKLGNNSIPNGDSSATTKKKENAESFLSDTTDELHFRVSRTAHIVYMSFPLFFFALTIFVIMRRSSELPLREYAIPFCIDTLTFMISFLFLKNSSLSVTNNFIMWRYWPSKEKRIDFKDIKMISFFPSRIIVEIFKKKEPILIETNVFSWKNIMTLKEFIKKCGIPVEILFKN